MQGVNFEAGFSEDGTSTATEQRKCTTLPNNNFSKFETDVV